MLHILDCNQQAVQLSTLALLECPVILLFLPHVGVAVFLLASLFVHLGMQLLFPILVGIAAFVLAGLLADLGTQLLIALLVGVAVLVLAGILVHAQ